VGTQTANEPSGQVGRPTASDQRPDAGTLAAPPPTLAQDEIDDHGRIGYGRYGRFTPLALAALLIASLLAIGLYQSGSDSTPDQPASRLVGRPAPDVTLTLLDGTPLRLTSLRGSVVVLNFWASWCDPCRREMPVLQALHATGDDRVVVVGVGLKNDRDERARAFVRDLGLTYAIGRDTGGDERVRGLIELAFGVEYYPSTVFIRPDGVIAAAHLGELDEEQLRAYVAEAAETALTAVFLVAPGYPGRARDT